MLTGLGRRRGVACAGRGLTDCRTRFLLDEDDDEGGRFSSFVGDVDLKAAASDLRVGASNACRGFASTPCPAVFFVGLGVGMWDVLRLSVLKSSACLEGAYLRVANVEGWSRFN